MQNIKSILTNRFFKINFTIFTFIAALSFYLQQQIPVKEVVKPGTLTEKVNILLSSR
jgi:hypothetical protein